MAKKSSIEKNNRRKRTVLRDAVKRAAFKTIIKNKSLPLNERFNAQLSLSKLSRDGSKTRVVTRCELSGRVRSVHRKFRLSRIWIRILASSGELPGVTKASW